jgi:hypothetical protein
MSNTHERNHQLVRLDAAPGVTLRDAAGDDLRELERLAQLDSAPLPAGPIVIAQVEDEVRAAYSLSEQRAIADPFHRTAELVELLRLHARQRDGNRVRGRRRRRSTVPQPPGFGIGFLPPRLGRRTA